jgi:hypothetical protein
MKISIWCRIGFHRWRHVFGGFNTYHECDRCYGRMVRAGRGGYQPVNTAWLNRSQAVLGEDLPEEWDGVVVMPTRADEC